MHEERGRESDYETFRTSTLMSRRTIRKPDDGGWRHRRDLRLRHCDRVAVEQEFNTDLSGENAECTSSRLQLFY